MASTLPIIRLNFVGGPEEALLRDAFAIFDDNDFVTLWVNCILLETTRFAEGPLPTDEQLMDGLKAISTYHDRNRPANSSIMTFWPETYNTSTGMWSQGPTNLGALVQDWMKFEAFMRNILKKVGLEKLWDKLVAFIDYL